MLGLTTAEVVRGRDLLHAVQAPAQRRVHGRRLHQHALRGDGRRRDLRARCPSTSASGTTRPPTDGAITLERIECNAACDYAPVVMVNWEFFDNQTPASAERRWSTSCARAGRSPRPGAPTRCARFKEISRVLAGFDDGRADEGVGAGTPTLRGRGSPAEGWTAPAPPCRPAPPGTPPDGGTGTGGAGTAPSPERARAPAASPGPTAAAPPPASRRARPRPTRRTGSDRCRTGQGVADGHDPDPGPHRHWDAQRSWTLATYERARRLPGAARRRCGMHAGRRRRAWSRTPACAAAAAPASRPGMKWGFLPQARRRPALPRGQRRRVRAGHLQGHAADDGRRRTR